MLLGALLIDFISQLNGHVDRLEVKMSRNEGKGRDKRVPSSSVPESDLTDIGQQSIYLLVMVRGFC